ncbi:hypothetical protein NYE69_06765 [Paenibacillus sp. FSL R5-0527]|uniref:hypothetical protein n=1 Tax=Paenibacillus sp. FSL R5-0527 TaxID=2975321 RepID=UPI00097BA2D5|nr:hypothetical protein BK140_09175 [Paenibacillus macerans]
MTKQEIAGRLLALPGKIAEAEYALLKAEEGLRWYKLDLQKREDEIMNSGAIDGKNEAIRSAQLRSFTGQYREEVAGAEKEVLKAQVELRVLRTELEALKAVVNLLKEAA